MVVIIINAVHVSGGPSAHHQEPIGVDNNNEHYISWI